MNHVTQIARFPVKGLTAQILDHVRLTQGEDLPLDRIMAITDGSWTYDPANYEVRYKDKYIALMTHPKAALLKLSADEAARRLTITAPDGQIFWIDTQELGADRRFLDFLAAFLELPASNQPELVRRCTGDFADLTILDNAKVYRGSLRSAISVMNLASVRDLGAKMGDPDLDPRRLRANICFEGASAWEESAWMGKCLRLGSAIVRVVMATPRCAVTSVNPDTGERDLGVLQSLLRFYKHKTLGFYVDVIEDGEVRPGDTVALVEYQRDTHRLVQVPFNGALLPIYVRNDWVEEPVT